MSEVKWIKITTDIFDDEKIEMIETLPDYDTIIVIWFKLITLAGKKNDNGLIYFTRDIPYSPEMLAKIMNRPINTVKLALETFKKFGMIDIINDFITLLNWDKHQSLDKLEKIQEQNRLRIQKHRDKQKELCNVTVTLPVTQCNAIELDKELDIDKEYNILSSPNGDNLLYSNKKDTTKKKKPVKKYFNELFTWNECIKAYDSFTNDYWKFNTIWTQKELSNLKRLLTIFEKLEITDYSSVEKVINDILDYYTVHYRFNRFNTGVNKGNPTPSNLLQHINDIKFFDNEWYNAEFSKLMNKDS